MALIMDLGRRSPSVDGDGGSPRAEGELGGVACDCYGAIFMPVHALSAGMLVSLYRFGGIAGAGGGPLVDGA